MKTNKRTPFRASPADAPAGAEKRPRRGVDRNKPLPTREDQQVERDASPVEALESAAPRRRQFDTARAFDMTHPQRTINRCPAQRRFPSGNQFSRHPAQCGLRPGIGADEGLRNPGAPCHPLAVADHSNPMKVVGVSSREFHFFPGHIDRERPHLGQVKIQVDRAFKLNLVIDDFFELPPVE